MVSLLPNRHTASGEPPPRSLLDADEHYAEAIAATVDTIDQLLAGELDRVTVQPDGQTMLSAPQPLIKTQPRVWSGA
jgi:hypothetical protein